ncbi:hypothetical protein IAQ67_15640 [Paenibacillus peoriae]|uniref:Uncharacterized protein n=1 Tax=Paenibacillus peoriae TaxID=59893 RepID=A0A7H0Y2M1_9BACL|nr:hypothetical protein [Paenibacillus peoriae]QNR65329.1 hypothetical protein IAQ67_15640 [Paenibacillus peoriae]
MEYPRECNLQVVLESVPEIIEWYKKILQGGLKNNLSIVVIRDEKLKLTNDYYTEVIKLTEGLEDVKSDIQSYIQRNPADIS